ncbi:MAG: acyl-CoA dehydrogenase family protein [Bacteriovoracaceae bacterium]
MSLVIEEKYQEIRALARKFSDTELAPIAAQIDHDGKIPGDIYKKMAENGFFGIYVPESYDGAGMDYIAYAILIDEISRGCASSGVLLSAHTSLAVWPILNFGTEKQKQKYLPKMSTGEYIGCFCLSEPNSGSDAGSMTTFAENKGDYFELTGTKNFITNGREAGVAVVFAKTTKTDNYKGITAFIVETSSPGFKVQKLEDKLGIKGSSTAQIHFDKVRVPKENILGEFEQGFKVAMMTLDGGRIGIAARALGIAKAAFNYAKKYLKREFNLENRSIICKQFNLC